jgi:hypothetical protein
MPSAVSPRSAGTEIQSTGVVSTDNPAPQISPLGRALSGFFEAASAFIQKEHLEPFAGWKYDRAGYALNYKSTYMNIEKYNNYLFDEAATRLVEQAGQLGLALDKGEALAQLKAGNANVAAIKFSDTDRVKYLEICQAAGLSMLSENDVNILTDMYIDAKKNGLDATQVDSVAFYKGIYNSWGPYMVEGHSIPWINATPEEVAEFENNRFASFQHKIDKADEIKAKLATTSLGFDDETGLFGQLLNKRIFLPDLDDELLNFFSQMLDLRGQKGHGNAAPSVAKPVEPVALPESSRDKKELFANLKAASANIAAIKNKDADWAKYLRAHSVKEWAVPSRRDDTSRPTDDVYAAAKENGWNVARVHGMAFLESFLQRHWGLSRKSAFLESVNPPAGPERKTSEPTRTKNP